jgi:hypothetical protein
MQNKLLFPRLPQLECKSGQNSNILGGPAGHHVQPTARPYQPPKSSQESVHVDRGASDTGVVRWLDRSAANSFRILIGAHAPRADSARCRLVIEMGDHDIGGFDVAVQQALFVGVIQRAGIGCSAASCQAANGYCLPGEGWKCKPELHPRVLD